MASITINNSSITTTSNTVTINYTTDVTLSQVELTKDSSTWIKARTFSQTSASFDISSWTNGTYSNCKLRITYETVTNYGQIVLSTSTISLNEGSSGSFTVKLDSAPTSNQVVNLSVNNNNCSLNKSSLTFTPSNYSKTQSVTITGAHDSSSYSDKTSTITASSNGATSKTINVTIKNIDTPVIAELITLTLASSMSCNKGETFNITYSTNVEATKHELSMDGGYDYFQIYPTSSGTNYTYSHEAINDTTWNPVYRTIRVTDANGNTATGTICIDIVESTTDLTTTILNMQYASAHEVLPNAPIDDVWKDKPRQGKGSTIPTQSCTECASGTHTANESYSAGSLWSTVGQWGTIFKIKDTELVQNVGVEITDFKMWRYNVNTNQWVLINDTFDYGAFYYETFWDDGSAPLNDHKILSSDKKTYKCLMASATAGRCFHPFSTQKKWADYGFTSNPSYIVSQMKARLIVWDKSGPDNRASANLCMDVGGDYWIRQGASFDNQWRHNGDIAIGYYKKITNDWQYVYMTTCPQDWDKGFPCDK